MSWHEYVWKEIHDFSDVVSVIGVRPAHGPNRSWICKTMWWILIIASLALAFYQIQERFTNYVSFPSSVNINVVPATRLTFPQITICNENQYRRNDAVESGLMFYANFESGVIVIC